MDKRSYVTILSVHEENKTHTTLEIEKSADVNPGQFFMLTDYANGEKPFSVSKITESSLFFTIKKAGDFSKNLCTLKAGDKISVRGPYGNGFDISSLYGKRILMVGGGCGTAPLRSLVQALAGASRIDFVNGARCVEELLFPQKLAGVDRQFDITDDGSSNRKGTVLDVIKAELDYKNYDCVALSGPEPMLAAMINSLDGFEGPSFFLIERYMKCAIGICGQCSIDPEGVRVCVEGPVFTRAKLAMLSEFGSYKRDAAGIKRSF